MPTLLHLRSLQRLYHLLHGCPPELLCTEAEVYDLIVGLDTSKSTGPDGISAKMLRGAVDAVVPSLTRLFNLSITTGSFPELWKFSRIVPVPKSVVRTAPSNYRPISILSVVIASFWSATFTRFYLTSSVSTVPYQQDNGDSFRGDVLHLLCYL
jgi:hypothetical protein